MMRTRSAFSFLEVMIIILITAVTAAIAIPSYLDMRRTGSEARAAAALKGELLPACLQFQMQYSAQRDIDGDQLGDFPCHPAALAGMSTAAIAAETATTVPAILDAAVWGNRNGAATTNQSCQTTIGSVTQTTTTGALVDGWSFGILTGGRDTGSQVTTAGNNRLRDLIVTVFAIPTGTTAGNRVFAMSLNPFLYRGMLVETRPGVTGTLATVGANGGTTGMFNAPAGLPLAADGSPTPMRVNATVGRVVP